MLPRSRKMTFSTYVNLEGNWDSLEIQNPLKILALVKLRVLRLLQSTIKESWKVKWVKFSTPFSVSTHYARKSSLQAHVTSFLVASFLWTFQFCQRWKIFRDSWVWALKSLGFFLFNFFHFVNDQKKREKEEKISFTRVCLFFLHIWTYKKKDRLLTPHTHWEM